ncbi:CaiB/BaiF CoA transferase family protein [Novosphingobium album (ex Liu et al. 2023)]|uniref:CaiB/BaiF CoA-transferase family protein n=1 Tax=Novosphingobium album (ex Liu et al. 2023) TaxID=3031130 RepID=A0ABT5WT47_9SPHN|nr:CaiB/BaiF CoA-transferase family protein [Novosphingobium album (ex Liu et al. 2023)]MDE8652527.1 CaiB/BaiF CoA-transferase family protein [Novosphingobium album (ex Liu et al. 2023)]
MTASAQPLAGRRVLELGTMIAAPFATHILSQLGAEVIKIEPPAGDTTRALVRGGPSGTIIAYSHSKKAICLDLTTEGGKEIFRKLATTADVVIHNLAPSAARKLGVTADDCMAANPGIIHVHVKGYTHGPQADDLMTNPIAEAATGAMDDHRVDGRPTRFGPSYHDQFAGTYAVIRVLGTMLNPYATEADRRIEIGLYETGLHLAARDLAGMQLKTQLLGRLEKEGGGEFSMPGYGSYLTSDQRWVYLLILTDAHWAKLTRALAMPEDGVPEYARLRDRKQRRDEVEAAVRAAVGQFTFDDVSARLRAAGLGFNEVMPLERVLETPQARQPGKLRELDFRGLHFEVPEFAGQGEVVPNLPPPEIGEHTVELLHELGYSDEAAASLLSSGAAKAYQPGDFAWAPVRQKTEST